MNIYELLKKYDNARKSFINGRINRPFFDRIARELFWASGYKEIRDFMEAYIQFMKGGFTQLDLFECMEGEGK